jgi:Spy/CpxP family protein refolding chaperone
MRVRPIVLIIAAAAILAAPLVLFAQAGGGNCDGSGPHGPRGGQGMYGGPGGHGGHGLLRMLPRLAERLELTQGQQDQIQAIIDAQKPAMEDLGAQAAAARETFHSSYGIGDFEETDYRTFFEAQAQLHVEMQLIGASTISQVWDVLTPEQQQQLLDLLELFRDGRGGPRHGGGKRRGPQ